MREFLEEVGRAQTLGDGWGLEKWRCPKLVGGRMEQGEKRREKEAGRRGLCPHFRSWDCGGVSPCWWLRMSGFLVLGQQGVVLRVRKGGWMRRKREVDGEREIEREKPSKNLIREGDKYLQSI